MIEKVRWAIVSFVVFVLVAVPAFALLRGLHAEWWRRPAIRRAFLALVGAGVAGHAVDLALSAWTPARRWTPLSIAVAIVFLLLLLLDLSLPLAAAIRLLLRLLLRARAEPRTDAGGSRAAGGVTRREVIEWVAASLPMSAMGTGLVGVIDSFADPVVRRVRIGYPDLPAPLDGLRILQLTDLHLGIYRHLDHLERVLVHASRLRPDLVVVTGDVADDLSLLPDTLRMVAQLRAPLGAFACCGNHEHYRGMREVVRSFERSSIDLLLDASRFVRVGARRLLVAGADDPGRLHGETRPFFASRVERAMRHRVSGDFALLMCHRPQGCEAGARHGASLTLAGHTHGAQVGAGGRSAFEELLPTSYLRGSYLVREHAHAGHGVARSWLYTSAGFGHWLPFRLGCDAEAPVIVLERRA